MKSHELKDPYPYQVISDFCSSNDLNAHRANLNTFFDAAFGLKSKKIVDQPVTITHSYAYYLHLIKHLHRLVTRKLYPHKIKTYQEWAVPAMAKKVRKSNPSPFLPSSFCHTPHHLSFADLHRPYILLITIIQWKKYKEWKKLLYQWQLNALDFSHTLFVEFSPDDLKAYRYLNKILDLCFLIYTVELESSKVEKPYFEKPLLQNYLDLTQEQQKNAIDTVVILRSYADPQPLFSVLQHTFDKAGLNYYRSQINTWYYSACFKTHPDVKKNPIGLLCFREIMLNLIKELKIALPSVSGYSVPQIYQPDLLKKIVKHETYRSRKIYDNVRCRNHMEPWEYLPKNLSDRELRNPYLVIRFCLFQFTKLDYKYHFQELQDYAFSGESEREVSEYPVFIQLYQLMNKLVEACYLIFAAEMNFGNPRQSSSDLKTNNTTIP